MLIVYKQFEEKIQGEYIEENDLLTILADNIESTDILKSSLIYIDEFSGFTHQEYQVLKKFIELAKQVTLTVCTDSLEPSINPDTDIFYSNKVTVSKLINLVKENDLELEQPIFLREQPRFKNNELKHLEQNLYSNGVKKYENEPQNIKLFLAKNQYSEIENVAREVIKLVRDSKLRYRDIAVITNDIETYSNLIRAIFLQYQIPVFIDEKRDLNQNIIIQYILSIFEIFNKNFSIESVFNYLKTGFSDIEEDDIFKLENYCIKWGIKHNRWKKDFRYGKTESNKEEIEYLNQLRKQIVEPLLKIKESFGTAKQTTKAIYEFLQEQKIEDRIIQKITDLEEKGLIDLANEYESSYKIILDIFDEMVLVFGDEKLNVNKYIQILKTGLKNSELGKIPATQDQVIVGDIERTRSHKVEAVFIVGLNDGNFPSINRTEGFLDDKDREILKNDGIELAKGTLESLYEENFNIYRAFTTAEKQLYLSYASSESDGKSLRPSMFINKIKKIFPNIKEESDVIKRKYEITNKLTTYQELLENISYIRDNKEIDKLWYLIYEYYKEQNEWNEILEKDLKGIDYTNIPQDIEKSEIDKLYGNTLKTSVSKLEKYAACPFSYYLQYGLRLKEKEMLKVQNFDTGSFMHETIDEFFKEVNEENIKLPTLLEDENRIEEIVNNVIEESLDFGKKYTFVATSKYKVLIKRLKRIVTKALKYIIEGLVYSDFNISGTEVEFERGKEYKPIQLQILEDGKQVEITGKIDRIDTATSDDGKYLRIIDYKSSAKNIDLDEVYAGLQLQLLTYMDAVCKEEDLMPAGVLYFSLLEQIVSADKKISEEEIEEQIRKNFKMKGLILADVKIIKMHDKTLKSGTSKLIPAALTTSGEVNMSRTNGVSREEFKALQDYIYKTLKQISKEILSGKIDIKPYNKKGKTPCKYCEYKAICG